MSERVLIIDDSATVREQVKSTLGEAGYEVLEAVDGEDGLARIREGALSLVVCDVNMPNMNGIELLEKLRAEGRYGGLPILMLTTEGQPELIARAKALGARGWMVKPVQSEQLALAVKKLIKAAAGPSEVKA
jgi:two-component system chemotaxis response regulator CheY